MQSADQLVLHRIANWLSSQNDCWLTTVVQTYGSSPRPVGSLFACDHGGNIVGSLSGGCVEEDLVERIANQRVATAKPEFVRYGDNPEDAQKFELPCGGYLDVVIEPIVATPSSIAHFEHIHRRLEHQQRVRRKVDLSTGIMQLQDEDSFSAFHYDHEEFTLAQSFGPRWHLYVIGTNMVTHYVVELALILDYQITVIDTDRDRLQAFESSKVKVVCDTPDDVISEQVTDSTSAVVALSHDPRLDDMALMCALTTPAFYVGAMGSERTTLRRQQRLLDLGLSAQNLNRLHAPIGIPIGSKTPPEIAISVMAEITEVRNRLVAIHTPPVHAAGATFSD